ncbi:hypothetical protein KKG77_02345 [bacterium]|nr:hypothetical protein [bacterium]
MNFFSISAVLLVLLAGCSQKSAFSNFELSEEQEYSISNTQRAKIISPTQIEGVFTAVYLNNIYPQKYNTNDSFLIFLYTKDEIHPKKLPFQSNQKEAIKIEKIQNNDEFATLFEMQNSWNSCYLFEFESDDNKEIKFEVNSGTYKSIPLIYKK